MDDTTFSILNLYYCAVIYNKFYDKKEGYAYGSNGLGDTKMVKQNVLI